MMIDRTLIVLEYKIKHLELITGIIDRMGNNSFLLKGWSITLVVLIITITTTNETFSSSLTLILILIIIGFWGLDSYYLYIERLYRNLYDEIRKKDNATIDFSMNISHLKSFKKWIDTFFSITLIVFYLFLSIIPLVVFFCL